MDIGHVAQSVIKLYLSRVYLSRFLAPPRGDQGQLPLGEELQEQLEGGVQHALVGVLDLPQQEVGEAEQDVVTPVGEIHQQTLQRVLGDESQLVIHVDGQPAQKNPDQ